MRGRTITRGGTGRPQGGGFELLIWYGMRLTGIGLFVTALSHYLITHFIYDPAIQDADFVTARWSSLVWRTLDWLMLSFVVFHAFMGMRTIVHDYTRGGVRTLLTMGLYLAAIVLWVLGTVVLVTLRLPATTGA